MGIETEQGNVCIECFIFSTKMLRQMLDLMLIRNVSTRSAFEPFPQAVKSITLDHDAPNSPTIKSSQIY